MDIVQIESEGLVYIVEVAEQGATGAVGATGATGAAGQGVPVGGTTGQYLAKIDNTDFNTQWVTDASTMTEDDVIALIIGLK